MPGAATEAESVSLRSLSDKNVGLLGHSSRRTWEHAMLRRRGRLSEEDLLTSRDIIKLSETLGQLAKLQLLSETCRSTVSVLSLRRCRFF